MADPTPSPTHNTNEAPLAPLRARLHTIIFESDTPAGKAFDIILLCAILLSVVAVTLESVQSIATTHGPTLHAIEWFFTILFTLEYLTRLYSVRRPLSYAKSFFGVIDLLAILPTFLGLLIPGAQSLMAVRILRLIRIFRIFKLSHYVGEARLILAALRAARAKIIVFLLFIVTSVCTLGSLMYVIEGPKHGFTNIPTSIYWAIVTLTTVGYGDIAPGTPLGKAVASLIMILGYGVLAVPTGIVTTELAFASRAFTRPIGNQTCPTCGKEGHDPDAKFCKYCGSAL